MRSSRDARNPNKTLNAMKNRNPSLFGPLVPCSLIGLLGVLAACNVVPPAQDDPTRYFVLSDSAAQAGDAQPAAGGARIGLKAVRLESYLRRREMVVRTGENEVEFRDYRRWAEPLDAGVARVLRSRLQAAPGVALVCTEPFGAEQGRDFDVSVEIRRCEGTAAPSGKYGASLVATIEIWTTGTSPHVLARRVFVAPDAAWDGRDFDRLASLLSADVSALGQEVLAAIPARN
jgi:uncharacterized lipoprotein YmbA